MTYAYFAPMGSYGYGYGGFGVGYGGYAGAVNRQYWGSAEMQAASGYLDSGYSTTWANPLNGGYGVPATWMGQTAYGFGGDWAGIMQSIATMAIMTPWSAALMTGASLAALAFDPRAWGLSDPWAGFLPMGMGEAAPAAYADGQPAGPAQAQAPQGPAQAAHDEWDLDDDEGEEQATEKKEETGPETPAEAAKAEEKKPDKPKPKRLSQDQAVQYATVQAGKKGLALTPYTAGSIVNEARGMKGAVDPKTKAVAQWAIDAEIAKRVNAAKAKTEQPAPANTPSK